MTTTQPRAAGEAAVEDRPPVITALTGVRALAAAWVVVYHLQETVFRLFPATRAVEPLLRTGYLGVDVFFILSGFILSYNYADRLARLDGSRYRDFMVARLARIYPVHLFSLLLVAGLVAAAAANGRTWNPNQDFSAFGFLGNLLMLQGLPGVEAWNVPAWSISCEFAAYLVFPLFAGALLGLRPRTAGLLAAAALVAGVVALLALHDPSSYIGRYWVRIAVEFAAGCLLWRVWRARVRPGPRWDLVAVLCAAVTAGVLAMTPIPYSVLPFVTVPLLALFLVATASATGVVRSVLSSPVMQWGGRISYSLYLVHIPAFYSLLVLHSPRWFVDSPLVLRLGLVASYVVVMVVAAAVAYYAVEEPARRWITGRYRRSSAASDTGPDAAERRPA